jgi:hypothetical protein
LPDDVRPPDDLHAPHAALQAALHPSIRHLGDPRRRRQRRRRDGHRECVETISGDDLRRRRRCADGSERRLDRRDTDLRAAAVADVEVDELVRLLRGAVEHHRIGALLRRTARSLDAAADRGGEGQQAEKAIAKTSIFHEESGARRGAGVTDRLLRSASRFCLAPWPELRTRLNRLVTGVGRVLQIWLYYRGLSGPPVAYSGPGAAASHSSAQTSPRNRPLWIYRGVL